VGTMPANSVTEHREDALRRVRCGTFDAHLSAQKHEDREARSCAPSPRVRRPSRYVSAPHRTILLGC
jgi:hypothetical protein